MKNHFTRHIRSLDIGKYGFEEVAYTDELLRNATDERIFHLYTALKSGREIDEIHDITQIDRFFLYKIQNIIDFENYLRNLKPEEILKPEVITKAKRMGFSDAISIPNNRISLRKI